MVVEIKMAYQLLEALRKLVNIAESAADSANINLMDDAITHARAVIEEFENKANVGNDPN